MFSTTDTIVAIATPPGRGGHRGRSHQRAERCDDRAGDDRNGASHSSPRHATLTDISSSSNADRPRRRHLLPRAAFVHRRGRRGDQRAWQPRAAAGHRREAMRNGARLAEPGEFTLRAYLNAADRSRAGRGGARSGQRRHAAAGACGVRSTRRHADRGHPRDRSCALRSDGAPRGLARFSGRGLSLRRRERSSRRDCGRGVSRSIALLDRRAAGPLDPRGAARGARGPAQHRQVVAVQCSRRRGPGDRHRRARDDT